MPQVFAVRRYQVLVGGPQRPPQDAATRPWCGFGERAASGQARATSTNQSAAVKKNSQVVLYRVTLVREVIQSFSTIHMHWRTETCHRWQRSSWISLKTGLKRKLSLTELGSRNVPKLLRCQTPSSGPGSLRCQSLMRIPPRLSCEAFFTTWTKKTSLRTVLCRCWRCSRYQGLTMMWWQGP